MNSTSVSNNSILHIIWHFIISILLALVHYIIEKKKVHFLQNRLYVFVCAFVFQCEKIKKRNKALFGALRMAHSNSLDEIDQRILDAR